jgi:TonB family protein
LERLNDRQGFLLSMTLHLIVIMTLMRVPERRPETAPTPSPESTPPPRRVTLVSPETLRQMQTGRRTPAPPAPPRRPAAKDRISIGGPSEQQRKEPLILQRDVDLGAPKGSPTAGGSPLQTPATPAPVVASAETPPSAQTVPTAPAPMVPPRAPGGPLVGPVPPRSIAGALRKIDQYTGPGGAEGMRGVETGTGQQMGPLFFDPQGADFTSWINHFKNEVYRNWIVPQPALLGMRGHVDVEFTVLRDGRIEGLTILKSSGNAALDRAAANALLGSRLSPLPADYGPDRVTMQASFFYNEGPDRS